MSGVVRHLRNIHKLDDDKQIKELVKGMVKE
jgi:hypothetical protein